MAFRGRIEKQANAGQLASASSLKAAADSRYRPSEAAEFAALARTIADRRQAREQHLPKALFRGEIAWDILLRLYAQDPERRPIIKDVLSSVAGPVSTVLRWLRYLEEKQLITTSRDTLDSRCRVVELSDQGRSAMNACFREMLHLEISAADQGPRST